MFVTIGGKRYDFYKGEIEVSKTNIKDTFSKFNKKTLRDLIEHPRYEILRFQCENQYSYLLDFAAGDALMQLKKIGDPFYKQFLNNYGDLVFSNFTIKANDSILKKQGVYTIIVDNELVFTGVSANSFKSRLNQHIGNISPKSCYRDGTATHCHVNANITRSLTYSKVYFQLCPIDSKEEMKIVRNAIVNRFEPIWNIRFSRNEAILLV